MQSALEYLSFDGLDGTVSLCVDQKFRDAVPSVFPRWPHRISHEKTGESFIHIAWLDDAYTLSSDFMETPTHFRDPVNALCALIVEIAWARLRENPELLCLHGAAVEFSGRLLVFPSTRRAGKSTLTVALAAAGKTVFTDDFLPLQIMENRQLHGVASGIAPRLRLPIPAQIGAQAETLIGNRNMIANRQYQFVTLRQPELASFAQSAAIGALIFLDRIAGSKAEIVPVTQSDALRSLIGQNFSRAMNAAGILRILALVTNSAPAFTLIYDDAEPAIALLEKQFSTWDTPAPTLDKDIDANALSSALEIAQLPAADPTSGQFTQADGITVVASDGKKFLTGRGGKSIHYLNDGASAIWQLLLEPTSAAEAVELLHSAFPEQPLVQIEQDVAVTFAEFARNNLITQSPINCQTDVSGASYPDSMYQKSV